MVRAVSDPDSRDPGPVAGSLSALIARHGPRLMALPGVVGVAETQCNGMPCLLVLLAKDLASQPDIPASIEGTLVTIERTGPFVATLPPTPPAASQDPGL